MNAHQLDAAGVIVNTIVVDSLDVLPGLVNAAIGGSIGDRIINGSIVQKPVPAATVPQSVPALDARLTLIEAGKMGAVKAYIAALTGPDGEKALEFFERAATWRRNHQLVIAIPADILTEAEKDTLFIAAEALNA